VAGCVLVYAFDKDFIPADTHVHRISNRLGWVKTKHAPKTETGRKGDERIFEELCFCILTAHTSAKMGIKSIATVKTNLMDGSQEQLAQGLTGVYRFPNKRSEYITTARDYLKIAHNFKLRELIGEFDDTNKLRDFLVENIKGIGYKEASHFLRNIGFKGLCILDKHILNSLHELGILEEARPPKNRQEYLDIEGKMKVFAEDAEINIDELDLLLWSLKTGEILK